MFGLKSNISIHALKEKQQRRN